MREVLNSGMNERYGYENGIDSWQWIQGAWNVVRMMDIVGLEGKWISRYGVEMSYWWWI